MVDEWTPPRAVSEYVRLDHDRANRRGFPEAVLCDAKTLDQILVIAGQVRQRQAPTLFTRVRDDQVRGLLDALPGAVLDDDARIVAWPGTPPASAGGCVVVLAAGTSDLPVAREAAVTARHLGRPVELVVDVGVAGLHRVLEQLDVLRAARAIVVVAGMDGALPGVVAGLVAAPVIAVPTSVGYGAAFGGIAPLLTMLTACAPGVAVVNIDNGYGAGHLAAQIAAPWPRSDDD
jgi:pyridinium-3,5-biscarboxylic acid mononucleotide synthase